MKENESYQNLPSYTMRTRNASKLVLIFVVLFLLVTVALAGLFFLGYSKSGMGMISFYPTSYITPTVVETVTPLPTSSASAMMVGSVSPSSSAGELSTVDSKTNLDRGELTVAVLNGSGEAGAAGGVSSYLEDLGYKIGRVGNADVFTYQNLTVVVRKSKSSYAGLIKKDLQANPSFASVSVSVSDDVSADAEVIVGQ